MYSLSCCVCSFTCNLFYLSARKDFKGNLSLPDLPSKETPQVCDNKPTMEASVLLLITKSALSFFAINWSQLFIAINWSQFFFNQLVPTIFCNQPVTTFLQTTFNQFPLQFVLTFTVQIKMCNYRSFLLSKDPGDSNF